MPLLLKPTLIIDLRPLTADIAVFERRVVAWPFAVESEISLLSKLSLISTLVLAPGHLFPSHSRFKVDPYYRHEFVHRLCEGWAFILSSALLNCI